MPTSKSDLASGGLDGDRLELLGGGTSSRLGSRLARAQPGYCTPRWRAKRLDLTWH